METVLGLIGLAVFVTGVVTLAAAVTYTVVRLSPQREDKAEQQAT